MFKPRLHADRSFKEGGRYLIIQYQYISNIFIGIAAGEGRGHSPLALLPWAATGGKGFFVCMGKRLMNFLVGMGVELVERVLPFVAEAGVNFLWGNHYLQSEAGYGGFEARELLISAKYVQNDCHFKIHLNVIDIRVRPCRAGLSGTVRLDIYGQSASAR